MQGTVEVGNKTGPLPLNLFHILWENFYIFVNHPYQPEKSQ
jgi:hypothetical protein